MNLGNVEKYRKDPTGGCGDTGPVSRRAVTYSACLAVAFTLISCSRSPLQYVARGDDLYRRGDYAKAGAEYQRALTKNPKYGPAYYGLGLVQERLNVPNSALGSFRRAVGLLPIADACARDARIRLADLYLKHLINAETAVEIGTTANALVTENPNDYDGHRFLGALAMIRAAWLRTHDEKLYRTVLPDAIVQYQLADRGRPRQKEVMLGYARALLVNSRFEDAEHAYTAAINQHDRQDLGYAELYRLLVFEGKEDRARDILETAGVKALHREWFLTVLATHYFMARNEPDMRRVLDLLKGASKDPAVCLTVGDFYVRLGDADSAVRQYQACGAQPQVQNQARRRMVRVLAAAGRKAEASRLNDKILGEDPKDLSARGLKAVMSSDEDSDHVLAVLESAAFGDPQDYEVQYQIGRIHFTKREMALAEKSANTAIALREDFLPALLLIAQVQFQKQEYGVLGKTISSILTVSPHDPHGTIMKSILDNLEFARTNSILGMAAQRVSEGNYSAAAEYLGEYQRGRSWKSQTTLQNFDEAVPSVSATAYLKDSPCDAAIIRFKALQEKPKHLFELVSPVSGLEQEEVQKWWAM
jgi:tetratricopeptide (TPR) repeat protein